MGRESVRSWFARAVGQPCTDQLLSYTVLFIKVKQQLAKFVSREPCVHAAEKVSESNALGALLRVFQRRKYTAAHQYYDGKREH